jgi:hypothetical protein
MYIYVCMYIDRYTCIHQQLRMTCTMLCPGPALGRGTLATYALESAEADCLPTAADWLAYPSADAPLFALAMTAALRDAGALCDACKSKNRCQKPRLSPRSIF